MDITPRGTTCIQLADHHPTEYRLHKGDHPIWSAGAGHSIAEKLPSSATQLPILAALHAEIPTLFAAIIHDNMENVNPFFAQIARFCQK